MDSWNIRIDDPVLGIRRKSVASISCSEDVQFDAEIFLGVLADRLHQATGFDEHLIGIVIESFIFEELPGRALASFQLSGQF